MEEEVGAAAADPVAVPVADGRLDKEAGEGVEVESPVAVAVAVAATEREETEAREEAERRAAEAEDWERRDCEAIERES